MEVLSRPTPNSAHLKERPRSLFLLLTATPTTMLTCLSGGLMERVKEDLNAENWPALDKVHSTHSHCLRFGGLAL